MVLLGREAHFFRDVTGGPLGMWRADPLASIWGGVVGRGTAVHVGDCGKRAWAAVPAGARAASLKMPSSATAFLTPPACLHLAAAGLCATAPRWQPPTAAQAAAASFYLPIPHP